MQVALHAGDIATATADLVAIGVYANGLARVPALKTLDKALGGAVRSAAKEEDFTGKSRQQLVLHTLGKLRPKRLALLGLGAKEDMGTEDLLSLGGGLRRLGDGAGAKHVLLVMPDDATKKNGWLELVARGVELGGYRFDRYRKDTGRKSSVNRLSVHAKLKKAETAVAKRDLKRAKAIAEGVALARDLVNEPPLDLYPESFAARASAMARKNGLKVKVYKPADLKKMKMGLLLGVGAGSARTPRLVHLSYTPPGSAKKKPVVIVGKGITFDSGGLDLKSPANMLDMKMDMGGAAAVMGTLLAISQLKPKTPIHGILALAENMPSGTAIRPGDVLRGASGRTVEVNNTDAEGRLVLGDALHFAGGLNPARVIDLATLTGACVVALGNHTVGLFSNNDELAEQILESSDHAGEHFWRMPLNTALKDQLKSDVADTKNTGERWGGAITAALFLSEFVGKTPWAHLDIAGPAMSSKDSGAITKGGTGVGVATLVDLLTRY